MSRRFQENLVSALVLAFFVAILVISFDYGPRARLVPVPVSILGILLTLAHIIIQNRNSEDSLHIDLLEVLTKDKGIDKSNAPPPVLETKSIAEQLRGFAVVGILLGLFLALGPFPSVLLFVGGYLVLSGYCGVLRAIIVAIALTAVLWLLFVVVLRIQVYWGLLEPVARAMGL